MAITGKHNSASLAAEKSVGLSIRAGEGLIYLR